MIPTKTKSKSNMTGYLIKIVVQPAGAARCCLMELCLSYLPDNKQEVCTQHVAWRPCYQGLHANNVALFSRGFSAYVRRKLHTPSWTYGRHYSGQHWTTLDDTEQHWTTLDNTGQHWTTLNNPQLREHPNKHPRNYNSPYTPDHL